MKKKITKNDEIIIKKNNKIKIDIKTPIIINFKQHSC